MTYSALVLNVYVRARVTIFVFCVNYHPPFGATEQSNRLTHAAASIPWRLPSRKLHRQLRVYYLY